MPRVEFDQLPDDARVWTHEGWLEDHRYLNMEFLKEQKKDVARLAA